MRLLPFVSWGLRLFPQRACPTTSSGFGMVDKGFFCWGGVNVCFRLCLFPNRFDYQVIRQSVFFIRLGMDRSDMQLKLTEVDYSELRLCVVQQFLRKALPLEQPNFQTSPATRNQHRGILRRDRL